MSGGRAGTVRGGLLVRGLAARRGLSLAVLVAASLTVAAAALGPTWARAAAESTLRDQLLSAPVAQAGVRLSVVYPDTSSPDVLLQYGRNLQYEAPSNLFAHSRPIAAIETHTSATAAGGDTIDATVVSRAGSCRHLVIEQGRCPTAAGEVIVSSRSLDIPNARWRLGGPLELLTGPARIVGTYRPRDVDDPFWFGDRHFDEGPTSTEGFQSDDLFAAPAFFDRLPAATSVQAQVDYILLPQRVRLADLPHLRRDLKQQTDFGLLPGYATTSTGLGPVLVGADRERSLAGTGTLLVSLQLGLLGLLVLFQIAADLAEARGPDIALAKLRGHASGQVLRFGLAGPCLLLLIATPIGIAVGTQAAVLLGGGVLAPGTPVVPTVWTLLAGLAALVGGLAAVTVAAMRVLTRSVTAQWQQTTGTPRPSRASLAVDGVVVLAATGSVVVLQAAGAAAGSTSLLAPGLLVLAIALVGVRLLPVTLRPALPLTRASPRVGLLLATRQVVRRPAALRLATLLAVAVGLASFAVGGQATAAGNRTLRAQAEVGAATVLRVQAGDDVDPVSAVRRADPDGRWAMAAATWLPDGGGSVSGTVLAVDSARLGQIALPTAGGLDPDALRDALDVGAVPQIVVRGDRIVASITAERVRAGTAPTVQFELRDSVGRAFSATSQRLRSGTAEYGADVSCSSGCVLTGITWDRPALLAVGEVDGVAIVHALQQRSDGRTTSVDARLRDPSAWRAAVPVSEAHDDVTVDEDGVRDRFSGSTGYGGIASAAQPRVLEAVGSPNGLTARATRGGDLEDAATDVAFRISASSAVLPRVLDEGVMLDAEQLMHALPSFTSEASWQVWLAPDAPADAAARIARAGLPVQATTTVVDREAVLGRSGPALAFLLLVVSAVTGAVLAALGTAVAISASARRRSYEFAALDAIGVPRRRLLSAALLEQLLLLGSATLLGIPGGFLAGLLALPVIPEFGSSTPVRLQYVPGIGAMLLFAGAFALLVLAAAAASSLAVLRRSRSERLREGQE